MEPSSKKRKLAPKVDSSPTAQPQPRRLSRESPPPPPPHVPLQYQNHQVAHETPPVGRHDFESFARHLQDAAVYIQRQTERPPYRDVFVLLLSWEADSTVDEDIFALEQVLRMKYNFHAQRWQIPEVSNSSIKLGIHIASFLEYARLNHLIIIYYAGYGLLGSDGHIYWASNSRDDAAKLKWDGVRCMLEDVQSDVLFILDTCALPVTVTAGSHGLKQVIAACRPKEMSSETFNSQRSFTSSLVKVLCDLSSKRPFSVQKLYDELLSERKWLVNQAHRSLNGSSSPTTMRCLPILFTMVSGKRNSLILGPLASPNPSTISRTEDSKQLDNRATSTLATQIVDADSVADIRFDEARILVCTTFVGDASPDMSFFDQWLQNTPPLGSKIAVEGMFLGPPTMLLISMPQNIWNIVQHDKVCCFLGFISSHNMVHLYERLLGPSGVKTFAKEVDSGQVSLKEKGLAAETLIGSASQEYEHQSIPQPVSIHPGLTSCDEKPENRLPGSPPASCSFTPAAIVAGPVKIEAEVEDSAEMQEAAEQLKALSHVRHESDEAVSSGQLSRISSSDTISRSALDSPSRDHKEAHGSTNTSALTAEAKLHTGSRAKPVRRTLSKQETNCNQCSHAPFMDSSSLRKHVAIAHARPFPCAFSFAGCNSTFGSKNEWKRHIASQHLCLQYYRCSACPQSAAEGKGNEFNRKDLFTQHLRRMHAPFQVKKALSKGESKLLAEWEEHVKDMQNSCLVTRRQPPQKSACPKPGCHHAFEGPGSWDEWTEHVGRHMEKGEAQSLGLDHLLAQWALNEGIIEPKGDGGYHLCASQNVAGGMGAGNGAGNLLLSRTDLPKIPQLSGFAPLSEESTIVVGEQSEGARARLSMPAT